jgi:uncharacterized protein (TIGR03790 family)
MKWLLSMSLAVIIAGSVMAAGPRNVLVVMNPNSPDSIAVARYYMAKRGITDKYLCKIYCPTYEQIKDEVFAKTIRTPIKQHLITSGLKDKIDYIVLTKGIPIRTAEHWGIDSALTRMFSDYDAKMENPYFDQNKHFSHRDYDMYLVTRLDGLTVADAKSLVDRALKAKPEKGLFLLDVSPNWDGSPGYKIVNDAMRRANDQLKRAGFRVEIDQTKDFIVRTGLMGYYSWGSNDQSYAQESFNKLRFAPGSIAELAQSTSAYTLTLKRTPKGKRSYIVDLVAQGVTGVKGYVYEPYTTALAHADILFDRYTHGYNLAESFYAASNYVHWRDIVLGDPLCAPYRE